MQRVGKITRMLNLAAGNAGRINKMIFFGICYFLCKPLPSSAQNVFPHFVKPAIWRLHTLHLLNRGIIVSYSLVTFYIIMSPCKMLK